MEEENQSAAAIVRDLSRPTVQEIQGVPGLITQKDQRITLYPELLPRPKRVKANVKAMDVGGFIDYVKEYKLGRTKLFATTVGDSLSVTGKIDYHAAGEGDAELPSHCDHNITCPLTFSEEWKRWTGASDRKMTQKEFGVFLEDNLTDIIQPESDLLMNAVLNFVSQRKVEFKSSQRLADGLTQFTYNEADTASQISLPTAVTVAIPVFVNGTRYELQARLKHRIDGPNLSIWYEIVRPDKVVELALKAVLADIATQTGITPIRASVALA